MEIDLSQKFIDFAQKECEGSSELYKSLSLAIAEDKELLDLAANSRDGQPIPNLFLGAVHYLLLKGYDHGLKEFYPSIVANPRMPNNSFLAFKDFCQRYLEEIKDILKSRLVQTNEVRRCSYLYPTFKHIFELTKKPLALIEIGTSAGLQLLWDQYRYSYGTSEIVGKLNSNVLISSEIRGESIPFLHGPPPPVVSRIGIDLNIIDLSNDDDFLWLNSLIWPNHHERRSMFAKAANYVRESKLELIEGNGVCLLKDLAKNIATEHTICIFHTHVANQMPIEARRTLVERVKAIGKERDIFHIYNNIWDRDLHLDYYLNGKEYNKKIGETDGHGRWFTWEMYQN